MRQTVTIAIGSNLATAAGTAPIDTCRQAVRDMAEQGFRILALSAWYRTAPIPASDQPDYINGVLSADTDQDPADVLARLHQIEDAAGRVRSVPDAARPLDLDLLAAGALVRPGPGLVVPHPRLHLRAFVLYPLCDVAPEWRHPLLGLTAAALRERLGPQRIERLADTTEDLLLPGRALR